MLKEVSNDATFAAKYLTYASRNQGTPYTKNLREDTDGLLL